MEILLKHLIVELIGYSAKAMGSLIKKRKANAEEETSQDVEENVRRAA